MSDGTQPVNPGGRGNRAIVLEALRRVELLAARHGRRVALPVAVDDTDLLVRWIEVEPEMRGLRDLLARLDAPAPDQELPDRPWPILAAYQDHLDPYALDRLAATFDAAGRALADHWHGPGQLLLVADARRSLGQAMWALYSRGAMLRAHWRRPPTEAERAAVERGWRDAGEDPDTVVHVVEGDH